MTERVDVVVVGAGPAGLRAAQVLAEAGREVLVVERHAQIGPKTCAGGLTPKAVRELRALGLPDDVGVVNVPTVSFFNETPAVIEDQDARVRTVARATLGALQAEWTRRAGAEVRAGEEVRSIDLDARQVRVGERTVGYQHLIGADGSTSRVRRALGLPVARAYFAAEFNICGRHGRPLLVAFDSRRLASGYFWVFPHADYTSVGAGAPVSAVRPADLRSYLEDYVRRSGMTEVLPRFEGATIEVQHCGFHFRDNVHLVGDAAGVASAVTGEGIYAALVTGEEVARQILEPRYPAPKTRAWMRVKRAHDLLARMWLTRTVREASLGVLRAAVRVRWSRSLVTSFFLAG